MIGFSSVLDHLATLLGLDGSFPIVVAFISLLVSMVVYRLVSKFVDGEYRIACCKPSSSAIRNSPLVSYEEADVYLRGNPYISHGYRKGFGLGETLRSLFRVHNETANIWSHLIGFALFAFFTCKSMWDLAMSEAHADFTHQVTVVVYCSGAMTLLACSTTFHWIGCVSDHVYSLTARLDYTGIALLILVSFFPFMYSLFYCRLGWGLFYSCVISALTVLAIYVSWSETFSKPGYHWFRAGLFIAIGLFGGIPLPHACLQLGLDKSWPVLWPLMLMGALYIFGALLYAMHIPERFFSRGAFDYFGHSHFLFHMFVVAAALVHLWNVERLIAWRATAIPHC